jgi:hypothetical protein
LSERGNVKRNLRAGWAAVLIAALVAPYALKWLLPDIRRSLRRRTVEDAARRLALGLPAFKLARGRDLVDLLMADPRRSSRRWRSTHGSMRSPGQRCAGRSGTHGR